MASTVFIFFIVLAATLHMPRVVVTSPHHPHHHKHHHHPACSEPADLQDQWNRLHAPHVMGALHETFYLVPFLRQAAANHSQQYDFDLRHENRTTVFSGSKHCPTKNEEEFLAEGNPCPVYYALNTDPLRYPHVLLEAQCKCDRCQGISTPSKVKNQPAMVPTCVGEYYHVRVLRRMPHCVDNVYQYVEVWQKVQVGCSCRLVPRKQL